MIKIEIIHSNDPIVLGEHFFYYDFISIGNTANDRILLVKEQDKEKPFRICFKIYSSEKISVNCLPTDLFYKSQGKKVAGNKLHQKNDIIELHNMKIKIIDFKLEKPIENTLTSNQELVNAVELEYLYLEKVSHIENE